MNVQFEDENLKELVETGMNKKYKKVAKGTPFMAVHPGSILKDELEARGIEPKELAAQAGIPSIVLEGILEEKKNVDQNVAVQLEHVLGISSAFWLSLQEDYLKDCEVIRARKKNRVHSMLGKLPWNKVAF